MRGRFNIFQCAMLRWREFYPYNAVHAITLPGALDRDRFARAVDEQLEAWGLAEVRLDPARRRYEYTGARARAAHAVLPGGADPEAALAAEMERQYNLPFPSDGVLAPFRFFAVMAGDSFRLGVAYDHVFAGGDSIVALLKGIASRYQGDAGQAVAKPDLYPPTYARLFRREAVGVALGLLALPAIVARIRRCARPRYPYGDDHRSAFTQTVLDDDETAAVRRTAKAWDVTVNDLLLALLLRALGPEVTGREDSRRRREIGIASIINLRDDALPPASNVFGQFLSSFLVSHRVPPGVSLAELARDVGAQTREVKRRRIYLQTLWAIAAGGLLWRPITAERRNRMYARNYPVWAGITTFNVDPFWRAAPGSTPLPVYVRGVSTGPFTPLVLTPTLAGNRMTLGLSYRTAAFRPEDIARVQEALLASVRAL